MRPSVLKCFAFYLYWLLLNNQRKVKAQSLRLWAKDQQGMKFQWIIEHSGEGLVQVTLSNVSSNEYLNLFLSLLLHSDFSLVIPSAPVSAPLGSSVILPCDLSPALNARTFEVHWYKNLLHKNLVLLYKNQKVQENVGEDQYRNRVSLTGELDKGTVSLKLDNLTLADGGEYFCFVTSISWYEKGSMTLVVKGMRKSINNNFVKLRWS